MKQSKQANQTQPNNPEQQEQLNEGEEGEEQIPEPEREKTLSRFIYVTHYRDSHAMSIIKNLFEETNQPAFELQSVKEIYTRELTPEEQDNNEINYISGFQLIDNEIRITIIEGIADQAMKIVRKRLPKTQMNSPTFKVFTDEAVLFNKRIYSPFGLSLKCIKLRDTLNNLLTTFGIYEKANKFRDMYEAFIKIGSILNSNTMKEIAESKRFPEVVGLLGIERKYGDLLTEKDMTGIEPKERRTTKLRTCDLHFDDISEKTSAIGKRTTNASIFNQINKSKSIQRQAQTEIYPEKEIIRKRQRLDSLNLEYDEYLKQKDNYKIGIEESIRRNKQYIKNMRRKKVDEHFCKPLTVDTDYNEPVYLYSSMRKNYYTELADKLFNKYAKDTNNYYSYSDYALTLSFPKVTNKNLKYLEYLEHKSKFVGGQDFDRYKQIPRPENKMEKFVYLPKINNVL